MKKNIVIFLGAFLSCNAMVQNISPQLAQEQVTLLHDVRNNQITEQTFENIKTFYTKIAQQDARSTKIFISLLMKDLYDTEDEQYESVVLQRKMINWLTNKTAQRTKSIPITEPE